MSHEELAVELLESFADVLTAAMAFKELRLGADSLLYRLTKLGMRPVEVPAVPEAVRDNWCVAALESRMSTIRYIVSRLESRRVAAMNVAAGI